MFCYLVAICHYRPCLTFGKKQDKSSNDMNADWRAELGGLPTEDYFATCTRIAAIDYRGYLMFRSQDDGYMKWQAHSDWKDTIDRLLQCKHQGLLRKGEELQRKWSNNAYKHMDDMRWALQKRKRSTKLQSVRVTGWLTHRKRYHKGMTKRTLSSQQTDPPELFAQLPSTYRLISYT